MTDRLEREVKGPFQVSAFARAVENAIKKRRRLTPHDPGVLLDTPTAQAVLSHIRTFTAERDRLEAMVERMHERADDVWEALTVTREAMALFASVAQSGEQWSDRCQEALHRSNDAARALEPETEE